MPNDYPRSKPGTKSRFGRGGARDNTERKLPSYQQQDREQGERDTQAERKENDREDEDIDRKAGKEDEKKTKDVKATKPSGKERVTDNVNRTRAPAITNNKVGGAYSRVWGLSSHYSFYEPRFQNNNYFIPNALPLQQLLEIAVPLVARSNWIQKYEFTFNPYAVMTGYSYIYYIQIARAKKAAMDLKGREVSALSRFEKYNPFESIPIPDIFVPYYESIVATQMSDNKFSWIVPTWGFDDQAVPPVSWPSYAGFNAMTTVTFADFIRPNIPFMLSNLATFGAETGAGIFRHFDPERNFAPIEMDDGAVPPVRRAAARFMNANHNLGNAAGHSMSDFLNTCGTSIPFQFWNDNMREAQTYMKTSNFFINGGIDTVLSTTTDLAAGAAYTNPVTGANMRQTKAITDIDEYLYRFA